LGLSAAEAIQAFENLAGGVFSQKKWNWKDDMFKATKLEKAVKSVVESSLGQGRADALMYEEWLSNGCPA